MIKTLLLRKFQSWNRVQVDFAPITVIVGRGNTGKSALLRAIKYALTNRGGDDFIRYGARAAEVGITFDDDKSLMWEKERGTGGHYWLWTPGAKEQEFSKTGATVPVAVAEAAGLRALEVEKGSYIWPQLRLQFDGPFLLPESGSRIARILGKMTKLDVLVNAQIQVRRDKDTQKREQGVLLGQLKAVEEKVAGMPDIRKLEDTYEEAFEAVEEARHAAERATTARKALVQVQTYSTATRRRLQEFINAVEAVNTLDWRVRRARAALAGYTASLAAEEEARAILGDAERGCCK